MTCTWQPDVSCIETEWEEFEPDIQERALALATSSLLTLTNNRVGACPVTVRPCPPAPCGCGRGFNPTLGSDGLWRNTCCGGPCQAPSEIDLPGPVGYVESLRIDGEEIDFSNGDWRLDNGHLLVWQGAGPSPIPAYQDLSLPDTAPGTFSVTYSRSYPVAADGRIAVAHLALQFARACANKKKCSLPRGVQSVTRQGVSFTIEAGLFPNGLTGIDETDQFILKWNPPGSPSESAVVFDPRRIAPRTTGGIVRGSANRYI